MRIEPIYIAEMMFDNLKNGQSIWQDIPLFLDFNADTQALFMLSASLSPSYDTTYLIAAEKWLEICKKFEIECLDEKLIESFYETDDIFSLEEYLENNTLLPVVILNHLSGGERQLRGLDIETFFVENKVSEVKVSLESNKISKTDSEIFQKFIERYETMNNNQQLNM